jgi:hypothetical protein
MVRAVTSAMEAAVMHGHGDSSVASARALVVEVLLVLVDRLRRGEGSVAEWPGACGTVYLEVEGPGDAWPAALDLSVIESRCFLHVTPLP